MKSLKAAKDASTKSIDGLKDYSIKDGESLSIHLGVNPLGTAQKIGELMRF